MTNIVDCKDNRVRGLPSIAELVPRPIGVALTIVVAAYLLLAVMMANVVPTGLTGLQNAPDEAAHVNYVKVLATGHLPTLQDEKTDPLKQSYEWHQPPLYYLLCVPVAKAGVRAMRYVSIVVGLFAIVLTFLLSRIAFPNRPWLALLAAGVEAMLPAHIAISSSVNNDILLEVCFTGVLTVVVIIWQLGATPKRAVLLGICCGAALLTKATALILLPVLATAAVLALQVGIPKVTVIRTALISAISAVAICGWWYVHNMVQYHELLPLKEFAQSFSGTAMASQVISGQLHIPLPSPGWPGYYMLVTTMTFKSFWAVYGSRELARYGVPAYLPSQVYVIALLVTVCCASGFITQHFRRNELFDPKQLRIVWLFLLVISLVAISFAAFVSHYFQTQGRYLYPALGPLSILMAQGWLQLFGSRREKAAAIGLIAFLGLMAILFFTAVQAASV